MTDTTLDVPFDIDQLVWVKGQVTDFCDDGENGFRMVKVSGNVEARIRIDDLLERNPDWFPPENLDIAVAMRTVWQYDGEGMWVSLAPDVADAMPTRQMVGAAAFIIRNGHIIWERT